MADIVLLHKEISKKIREHLALISANTSSEKADIARNRLVIRSALNSLQQIIIAAIDNAPLDRMPIESPNVFAEYRRQLRDINGKQVKITADWPIDRVFGEPASYILQARELSLILQRHFEWVERHLAPLLTIAGHIRSGRINSPPSSSDPSSL